MGPPCARSVRRQALSQPTLVPLAQQAPEARAAAKAWAARVTAAGAYLTCDLDA